MKKIKFSLTTWIFIGLVIGAVMGKVWGEAVLPVAAPVAELFLRLLRMTIMPLIITSILSGILAIGSSGGLLRLGLKTMAYFLGSTLLAIFTGQLLVDFFQPGSGAQLGLQENIAAIPAAEHGLLDIFSRLIPDNVFSAIVAGEVLPVIFFCLLFGAFILRLEEPFKSSLSQIINGAYHVMMKIVHLVISLAPIGVLAVTAKISATTGVAAFKSLGFYFFVVLAGLFLHIFVTLPILLLVFARVNPLKHYRAVLPVLLTAFSTSSSMAALPLNIEYVVTRCRVSEKIASFVLPIGATVNMNGTALYECVAAIFIAQVYGIELSLMQQGVVVLTALLAAVGSAGIPMAGLVMMSIVLQSVGLPLEGIGIILAVDRILDMFRTTLNVLGDSCGAVIVARSEGETLEGFGEPVYRT
jgi:proton glutamate symport protein